MRFRIIKLPTQNVGSGLPDEYFIQTKGEDRWFRKARWRMYSYGPFDSYAQARGVIERIQKNFVVWESE